MARKSDGRVLRGERTRSAIVEACTALLHEEAGRPSVAAVAARAGVPVRTLWAHFHDVDTLFIEAIERSLADDERFRSPVDPELALPERVDRFCDERLTRLERIAPLASAATRAPLEAEALHERRRAHLLSLEEDLRRVFARELARAGQPDALLDGLLTLTSFNAWSLLAMDFRRDREAVRRCMVGGVHALLSAYVDTTGEPTDPEPPSRTGP